MGNIKTLKNSLIDNNINPQENHILAPYTTWRIGGPADLFIKVESIEELILAVKLAKENDVPYTILGWGSNVLISDKGIRGLVIKNASKEIVIKGRSQEVSEDDVKIAARLIAIEKEEYYDFSDLDYDETSFPKIQVSVASGVYLPYLINVLIDQGITGLQWFAGIPGTVGGAVYNNIHGGTRFFSEVVESVNVLTENGEYKTIYKKDLEFNYDFSIFHTNNDVILSVNMILRKGDKERARNTSIAWATRKRLQPANSAGCCFQNIDDTVQSKLKLESNSWGYIIDKILGLKGKQIGKAKISEKHAAFIETQPGASSDHVLGLFEIIYTESEKKLGITPRTEIFFLGFEGSEINKYSKSKTK